MNEPQRGATIIQDDLDQVPVEILAKSIEKIAEAVEQMLTAGLSRRAILVLLRDSTGLGMKEIDTVIQGLSELTHYLQEETQ